jgi:branched-chain amino acid transport system permease protein
MVDLSQALRSRTARKIPRIVGWNLVVSGGGAAAIVFLLKPGELPLLAQIILALVLVVPLGPMIYRLAYQPLAEASVLVLLIVSVAVHLAMTGLGLLFFGAEGSRTPAFSDASFDLGMLTVSGQTACGFWVPAFS